MVHQIFTTDLVLEKIFSFVDFATAKELKLVSWIFSQNFKGCQGNIYLKLKDADQIDSEAENVRILEWAVERKNAWALKGLKIPIQETMRSCVIQNFLEFHGFKATNLHVLFRKKILSNGIDPEFRPVLCAHSLTEIFNLLSRCCPNIEHFSIQANLCDRDINEEYEKRFPHPVSKLKYLTEQRFPRFKKLSIVSDFKGIQFKSLVLQHFPLKSIHAGVKELNIASDINIEVYVPVLLSIFPNVESLRIKMFKGFDSYKFIYGICFPSVKKVRMGWDGWPPYLPATIKCLMKLMPNVEKLEVLIGFKLNLYDREVLNLKMIAKAIEGSEGLEELKLVVGEKCKKGIKEGDLGLFPQHLKFIIKFYSAKREL